MDSVEQMTKPTGLEVGFFIFSFYLKVLRYSILFRERTDKGKECLN
jgi:hypothetical protein